MDIAPKICIKIIQHVTFNGKDSFGKETLWDERLLLLREHFLLIRGSGFQGCYKLW